MNTSENSHLEYQAMCKDTTHFINSTKNIQLDPDNLLVTVDVSSLYTNIPHTEAIAAINKMMEETGTDTLLKMLISYLTYQVLTKNYFQFNDQLFEQTQEQQWEQERHQVMQLYLCTTWKLTSEQATQNNQKFG